MYCYCLNVQIRNQLSIWKCRTAFAVTVTQFNLQSLFPQRGHELSRALYKRLSSRPLLGFPISGRPVKRLLKNRSSFESTFSMLPACSLRSSCVFHWGLVRTLPDRCQGSRFILTSSIYSTRSTKQRQKGDIILKKADTFMHIKLFSSFKKGASKVVNHLPRNKEGTQHSNSGPYVFFAWSQDDATVGAFFYNRKSPFMK